MTYFLQWLSFHINCQTIEININKYCSCNSHKPLQHCLIMHSIVAVVSEVTSNFGWLLWPRHIKAWNEISTFTIGQIMFYSRIFNSQAQLSTRDIQKLDFDKVKLYVFTLKKPKFIIFDMLPERPTISYCIRVRKIHLSFPSPSKRTKENKFNSWKVKCSIGSIAKVLFFLQKKFCPLLFVVYEARKST